MIRRFSLLISRGCVAVIVASVGFAGYLLFDLQALASLAKNSLQLSIQWQTVTQVQWQLLWLLSVIYVAIGLVGLYFLRRAFSHFARGELFNPSNSQDLRMFSILLFIQALSKPLHLALSSVLLSWNHPAGQKMLSLSLGTNELKTIALAAILLVMSELLVQGSKLENENKLFI